MRYALVMVYGTLALFLLMLVLVPPAPAQVSIGIGLPGISIGINLPVFPELVVVPDYPVYYARGLDVNLFFYDGLYWVYQGDNWYASSWYNGPWVGYAPEVVPVFILRIPVSYYRHPPAYWTGWSRSAPPRWGQHWGPEWERRRRGWDQWDSRTRVVPAPLPVFQRQYSADRYPREEHQQALHNQNYRYQPQDPVVRQHYQQQAQPQPMEGRRSSPPLAQQDAPSVPGSQSEGVQRSAAPTPPQQGAREPNLNPRVQRPPQAQREAPKPQELQGKADPQQPQQERKQQSRQGRKQQPQQGQGHEQEHEQGQGHERGQGHKP
jgi:hypothetical protein